MSQGFTIYDASGELQMSSENLAYLLLDTIFVNRPNSGSRSYTLPQGMVVFANWTPSVVSEFADGAEWSRDRPTTESNLNISWTANTISWSWVNSSRSSIDSAIIRVFAA